MSNVNYTAKLVRGQTYVYINKIFKKDIAVKVNESEAKYLEKLTETVTAGANLEAITIPLFKIEQKVEKASNAPATPAV